jgi:uncharacterized membrane protein YjjB (DUF3815 family)
MMEQWLEIISKAFWCGWAAFGFSILFNTPRRALRAVWICGFIAGFFKFLTVVLLYSGGGMIIATLFGSVAVGLITMGFAHVVHVPPIIISIPAVIPLVPGSFAYRTMLGLIKFISVNNAEVLTETIHNGVMTLFIILAISLGVTLPMLLFRVESVKKLRIFRPIK